MFRLQAITTGKSVPLARMEHAYFTKQARFRLLQGSLQSIMEAWPTPSINSPPR